MSRLTLSRQEFLKLHDVIIEQYHKECGTKGYGRVTNKAQIYGYGDYNDHPQSLVTFMNENDAIKAHLDRINKNLNPNHAGFQKIIGKNLYNKYREATKSATEDITLTEPHSVVYFLYIGCKDVEAFREKYGLKQHYETYVGYYYSRQGNAVKSFQLQLAYAHGNCTARVMGFHEGRRQDPFKGSGHIISSNLFVNCTNPEGIELKLIIPTEGNQILLQSYMMGVLTTITSDNFPISVRIFLARVTTDAPFVTTIPPADEFKIKRYLNLQREVLRAPADRINTLDELSVRDEFVANLEHMIGTYWMWRYVEEDIVQIKMRIEDDFTVQLEDPLYYGFYANQIGRFDSSRVFNHSLCISTFPSRGFSQQIVSFYMMEIPQTLQWQYLKGNYSNVGNPNHKSSGGAVALYKQKDNFFDATSQLIKRDDISHYLETYPEFVPLKTMLDIQSGKQVKS